MSARGGTKTRWPVALALIGASLAVSALIGEALVRLFAREPILPRFVCDAGYGVRDNMRGVRTRHSSPGDYAVTITTNAHGMRNARRDYTEARRLGVSRTALLGDSFVFGFGVEDEEVVSARLEDLLNDDAGSRREVLNFGVPGFGQAEELFTYWNKVRAFAPDAVVLFYFENDLGNNEVADLFTLDGSGRLSPSGRTYLPGVDMRARLYAFAPTHWLFEHSQLWSLVRNRLSLLVQRSLLASHDMDTFVTPSAHAVVLTRALLHRFVADLRHDDVLPIVFVIPTRDLTSNFPMSRQEVLAAGADLVDGRDFLDREDYFVRDTHWRPSGHDKAARALAARLEGSPRPESSDPRP